MVTFTVIVRIARLVWVFFPFLLTVVFNDRLVKEVIRENIMFTFVFFLLLVTTTMSLLTSMALGNLRTEYNRLHAEFVRIESTVLINRREGEHNDNKGEQCIEGYDPYRALRQLDLL